MSSTELLVEANALPLDIEAELACHLTKQSSVEHIVREGLSTDLINIPRIKSIFQFVVHHFNTSGIVPTKAVLEHEFPNFDFAEPVTTVEYIVEKLRDRFQRKRVENLTLELAKRVNQPEDAMRYLHGEVLAIERVSLSQRDTFRPGDHKAFLRDLQDKILEGMHHGASFGFLPIDNFTGGLKKGQVGYILARPKRKKTFLQLQSFIEMVKHKEEPFLFTLELTREEIVARLSCMLSGVSWDRYTKGDLMPQDYEDMDEAWSEFNSWGGYHIECPPEDERTVMALGLKADKVDAGPIIISQFAYLESTKDVWRAEHEKHAEIAVALKQLAIRSGKERPVYVEAHFNRGGDTMQDLYDFDASKVGLTDMIPKTADILMGIVQSKEMRANQQLEFGVIESRNTDNAAWYIYSELKSHTEFRIESNSQH